MLTGQAFAYNYDIQFKTAFYDSFIVNFFQTLQQSLLSAVFLRFSNKVSPQYCPIHKRSPHLPEAASQPNGLMKHSPRCHLYETV